jgi:hypothetical protein
MNHLRFDAKQVQAPIKPDSGSDDSGLKASLKKSLSISTSQLFRIRSKVQW